MLRNFALALGVICLLGGLWGIVSGFPPGFMFAFFGALLVAGIIYERVRYKPIEKAKPGPGWEKTAERFVDDATGKPVTVYIRPETGERMYVEE
ncbi:MAG TPA: hypothetical protein VGT78_06840 [Rhizomicrobium sp.]|nr:hypothetical protein [Rhizomicrobium sp.]